MDASFLRKQFVVLDIVELKRVYKAFLSELRASARGKKTSLPFIVHELPSEALVEEGEVFQVMVIGGSVFQYALGKKPGGEIVLFDRGEEMLPKFQSKQDLLTLIETHLSKDVSVLAVNFAYPLSPILADDRLDGVLLAATKEHVFSGLVGEQVGKAIGEYFRQVYNRKIRVSVANDTICLLLSGLTRYDFSEIAGGIIGTGTNFALFLDKHRLVNLESANFDRFPFSKELKVIDVESNEPGKSLFEKETAGAYLYKHFNSLLSQHAVSYSPISSSEELSMVAGKGIPLVSEVARLLLEKSAALLAAEVAGIAMFKSNKNLVFIMEGSLFWQGEVYKEFVREYLDLLLPGNGIMFVEIEESPYLGAAKLVA